jgi:hypothetical protein
MERFLVLRHALGHKPRTRAAPDSTVAETAPVEQAVEDGSGSKLGALLVLLVPLAGAAWAVIGWFVYRLVG